MKIQNIEIRTQNTEAGFKKNDFVCSLSSVFCLLFSVFCVLTFSACSGKGAPSDPKPDAQANRSYTPPDANVPPLILSILPVESAGAMYQRFLPLKYYLEKTLGVPVTIKIARDYESAIDEIGSGRVHMAYLDPAAYCEVRARYKNRVAPLVRAIGKQGSLSRSVLVVKAGSPTGKVVDIKGKRLALGSRQSSFSYLVPLSMLHDVGIGIRDFSRVDYLHQEDRVALSVLIGDYDVGAMSESVAGRYLEDGLRIVKRSEVIPQFVLCASDILPADRRKDIVRHLVSARGREILSAVDRDMETFVAAEDRDFDVIRVMMKNITGREYMEYGHRTIRVAILPLYSAITIYERYEPLMKYLSRETGYEFKLVIPRDFDDFVRIVQSGAVDFSYQNPYVFALIDRDRDIKPLVTTVGEDIASSGGIGGGESFSGVIITRHDSPIRDVKDLKGRKVMVVSRKSAGGYLSQKLFLEQLGIDTERDMHIIDAKRQENVIFGVYRGAADAGFVRESALVVWKEEIDMKKIRVLARTKPLPNWPFAMCRNVNSSLAGQVKRLLIELNDAAILKSARVKGFKSARESDFDILKRY